MEELTGDEVERQPGIHGLSQSGFEFAQTFQGAPATLFLLRPAQRRSWRRRGFCWGWRTQAHPADVEVLFETIQLEEIGEFEGTDVPALGADFPLEIKDDPAQILQREARVQELIPPPLPVKSQAQSLTRQLAVELVGLLNGRDAHRG